MHLLNGQGPLSRCYNVIMHVFSFLMRVYGRVQTCQQNQHVLNFLGHMYSYIDNHRFITCDIGTLSQAEFRHRELSKTEIISNSKVLLKYDTNIQSCFRIGLQCI